MDWKICASTFVLIFLAELGDKTQLTVFTLGAEAKSPLSVFVGGAAALSLTTLIGVFLGQLLFRVLPSNFETYLRCVAGVLFILFGVLMLAKKL